VGHTPPACKTPTNIAQTWKHEKQIRVQTDPGLVSNNHGVPVLRRHHPVGAIVGTTLEGVITSWNTGAQRLYGYTAKEALGQPTSMIVPPERSGESKQNLETIHNEARLS
jgi:PAS domain-containing protein